MNNHIKLVKIVGDVFGCIGVAAAAYILGETMGWLFTDIYDHLHE